MPENKHKQWKINTWQEQTSFDTLHMKGLNLFDLFSHTKLKKGKKKKGEQEFLEVYQMKRLKVWAADGAAESPSRLVET